MDGVNVGIVKRGLSQSVGVKAELRPKMTVIRHLHAERMSPKHQVENEKKVKREIANSNERRRMQSINAGFNSLKMLVPYNKGEKMSKAAILQHTSDYIRLLITDKSRLALDNERLKKMLSQFTNTRPEEGEQLNGGDNNGESPSKRRKNETESSDEGFINDSDECAGDQAASGQRIRELRFLLDRERQLRLALEERNRVLEAQMLRRSCSKSNFDYETEKEKYLAHQRLLAEESMEQDQEEDQEQSDFVYEEVVSSAKPGSPFETCVPNINMAHSPHSSQKSESKHPEEAMSPDTPGDTVRSSLQTIVEAIRHLEGDYVLEHCDNEQCKECSRKSHEQSGNKGHCHQVPATSEESEAPLSSECDSEGRSCNSPVTGGRQSPSERNSKYPIAMRLLHRKDMQNFRPPLALSTS